MYQKDDFDLSVNAVLYMCEVFYFKNLLFIYGRKYFGRIVPAGHTVLLACLQKQ